MFRDRGVKQVKAINPLHVGETKDGVVAFELRINASVISPEMERQMVARLRRWLDRVDPQLRVVQGGTAAPLPDTR